MKNVRKKMLFLSLTSIIALIACSKVQPETRTIPQKPSITFSTLPAAIQIGHQVKLIGTVKQKQTPVTHAEMTMEIWREGDSKHEKMEAVADNEGHYTVTKAFTQAGTYKVILHTSTTTMHIMPTEIFTVSSR